MTGQDMVPDNALTSEDMARLRAAFQREGMSLAQAAEGAQILAGMVGTARMLRVDMREVLATLDRILARQAAMVERDRRP
jgi:hypothetical protein